MCGGNAEVRKSIVMEPMNRDVGVLGVKNPQAGLWNTPPWLEQRCVYCDKEEDNQQHIHMVHTRTEGFFSAQFKTP